MKYKSRAKPRKCPKCGAKTIASILYGLPDYSEELKADIDAGKIVLGGCCITYDDPKWQCTTCETVIYKEDLIP